ncbi:LapB repeat-containing protein [Listeria swaminathanii]|uniref:LapB repeat-containing protein n=1 Tax=Listeria swaminathanii TaxID=2713501 RepID=A0ABU2IIA9_9LIST|nr:MucBP domain-containing protein [Listeria swaminathanii]MDT0017438.1 LapB repeat-containing protein [Listeria swaminathanii]MDT0023392.1 LapB repeat-containing protein [Listeria swaminathanii]MDT0034333.1 LapB repeat-containing protein [Listeria swaminathanii]MDT0053156.1 LapB repeat-containing protein [Listeria swaminathanii]MDT0055922.1 LapB repeat-containing protein [Listeria swaminathanii]
MVTKKKTIASLIILGSLAGQIALTPISALADTNDTNNISLLQSISENVNVPYKYTSTLTFPVLTNQTAEDYKLEIKLALPTGMNFTDLHVSVAGEDMTNQVGTTSYDISTNTVTFKFDKVTSWDSLSAAKVKFDWNTTYSGEGGEANIDSLVATASATSTDKAGNKSTSNGTLKPKDISAPVVKTDKTAITYNLGTSITEEQFLTDINASVTDNYDSTVSLKSNFTSSVNLAASGDYSVNVQATDKAGNVSNTVNVMVHVASNAPVAGANITVNYLDGAGNKLAASDTITGTINSNYQSTSKKITGYTLETTPKNATGTFTDTAQTVNYIYKKDVVTPAPVVDNPVAPVVKKPVIVPKTADKVSTPANKEKTTYRSLPTTGDTDQSTAATIFGSLLILISAPLLLFKKK